MTEIQEAMLHLQYAIVDEGYYVNLYEFYLSKYDMTPEDIILGLYPDNKIINLCNAFWMDLPDSPKIRVHPFFALCDIAEHAFDEDYSDE